MAEKKYITYHIPDAGGGIKVNLRERALSGDDVQWITVSGQHIPIEPGQSKGDAVKQAFGDKGSDNPSTGGSISGRDTAGHKGAQSFEGKVYSDSKENAAVFSKNGEEILTKSGSGHNVSFSDEEISKMKGGILSHNHPANATSPTLSPSDYGLAAKADLSEMRAVSGNKVYIFTRGENGWPSSDKVADSLYNSLKSNAAKLSQEIKSGKITKAEAEQKVWKAAWRTTASECGFGYTVEARK